MYVNSTHLCLLDSNWWPMFVLLFYFLAPVPYIIAKRYAETLESSSAFVEMCIFLTTGIVVSAYGLPVVLAHTPLTNPVVSITIDSCI